MSPAGFIVENYTTRFGKISRFFRSDTQRAAQALHINLINYAEAVAIGAGCDKFP